MYSVNVAFLLNVLSLTRTYCVYWSTFECQFDAFNTIVIKNECKYMWKIWNVLLHCFFSRGLQGSTIIFTLHFWRKWKDEFCSWLIQLNFSWFFYWEFEITDYFLNVRDLLCSHWLISFLLFSKSHHWCVIWDLTFRCLFICSLMLYQYFCILHMQHVFVMEMSSNVWLHVDTE